MFNVIKNKKLRNFVIFVLTLVIIFTLIFFTFNLLKDNYRNIYKQGEEIILEQDYNSTFNEFIFKTKMTDIYIKNSSDNNIKIIVYGEKDYLNIKEKNNKLIISSNKKNIIALDFYSCISKVELYIPNNFNKLIRIDSEFGNISVEEFLNTNFYINQKYGNLLAHNGNFIKVKQEYGNIDIKEVKNIIINSDSSNISINSVNILDIDSEFGNIEVENVKGYLNLYTENGDINLNNIVLEKNSNIKSNYGDIKINDTNEINISAKTKKGNVKIKNNYKKSNIKLNINNNHGNIEINN